MADKLDEAAVAALFTRHGHALHRRCLSLVGRPDEADELVQETFCQLLRSADRFEGRSSLFTFLYRIATNLSIDRLRRRRTAGDPVTLDEARHETPDGRGGHERIAAAQELAMLTEGLDDDALTTAVLAHVDGLTQEEIAMALDVSRRTVGKRLKKFLAHTRKRARKAAGTLPAPMVEAPGRAHGDR